MSEKEKIVLGSNGIKKVLKGFSPVEAVAEYIWNGYDANATFADKAKWTTTYRKDDKLFRYSIEITENDLENYSATIR